MGPLTGRGFGPCGRGYGRGYGFGGGWGRGMRWRGAPGPIAQPGPDYYGYDWGPSRASQREMLKEQQEILEDELKWVKKELDALEED